MGVLYGIAALLPYMNEQKARIVSSFFGRGTQGRTWLRRLRRDKVCIARVRRGRDRTANGVTDAPTAERIKTFYAEVAVPADSFTPAVDDEPV